MGPGIARSFGLALGEAAFGTNEHQETPSPVDLREALAQRTRIGQLPRHQHGVVGVAQRQDLVQFQRSGDLGDTLAAALQRRCSRESPPALQFSVLFRVGACDSTLAHQRHDARYAELDGLLDDEVHLLPFGNTLRQGDLKPRLTRRGRALSDELDAHALARDLTHDAFEPAARRVEDLNAVASRRAQHVCQLARIAARKLDAIAHAEGPVDEKAVHRGAAFRSRTRRLTHSPRGCISACRRGTRPTMMSAVRLATTTSASGAPERLGAHRSTRTRSATPLRSTFSRAARTATGSTSQA